MKLFAFSAFACIVLGGAAMACPDYNQYGATYTFSGSDLLDPKDFPVMASGASSIAACDNIAGQGYFNEAPDFTFDLSQMAGYRIAVRVASDCEAELLVNSANASWFYDDSNEIILDAPGSGFLDIWVGTRSGAQCEATVTVETL